MPRDGSKTRNRILDAAQQHVLRRGFAGTSIDDIQDAAGISRGTFFYHFATKSDLARALIERYAEQDRVLVNGLAARAEQLATDPLQQALIILALHEDLFQEMAPEEAGCLFASYSYEAGIFDAEMQDLIRGSIDHWREVFGGKLAQAIERHGTRVADVDPYGLADMAYGVLQGAFILRRALDDAELMVMHTRQFRTYLELLFGVAADEGSTGAPLGVPEAAGTT